VPYDRASDPRAGRSPFPRLLRRHGYATGATGKMGGPLGFECGPPKDGGKAAAPRRLDEATSTSRAPSGRGPGPPGLPTNYFGPDTPQRGRPVRVISENERAVGPPTVLLGGGGAIPGAAQRDPGTGTLWGPSWPELAIASELAFHPPGAAAAKPPDLSPLFRDALRRITRCAPAKEFRPGKVRGRLLRGLRPPDRLRASARSGRRCARAGHRVIKHPGGLHRSDNGTPRSNSSGPRGFRLRSWKSASLPADPPVRGTPAWGPLRGAKRDLWAEARGTAVPFLARLAGAGPSPERLSERDPLPRSIC
jgi:hypothetical protein